MGVFSGQENWPIDVGCSCTYGWRCQPNARSSSSNRFISSSPSPTSSVKSSPQKSSVTAAPYLNGPVVDPVVGAAEVGGQRKCQPGMVHDCVLPIIDYFLHFSNDNPCTIYYHRNICNKLYHIFRNSQHWICTSTTEYTPPKHILPGRSTAKTSM